MGIRVALKRLCFAAVLVVLVLVMSEIGYSQDCLDCHSAHGPINYYEGYACENCHSAPRHDFGNFTIPTFHDASGLICNKCHTMHASQDGDLPTMPDEPSGTPEGPNPHLLYKANVTDLCLVCHQAPMNGTGAPIVMTLDGQTGETAGYPKISGGDFFHPADSEDKGHNPYGEPGNASLLIPEDPELHLTPPGGTALDKFTCISCHDPHAGTATDPGSESPASAYRQLLRKPGDGTGSDIIVTGIEAHPGTDEGSGSGTNVARYYSNFSIWCGTCHSNPDGAGTGFHGSSKSDPDVGDGFNWLRHPTDSDLGSAIASNYGLVYDWEYPVEDTNQNGTVELTDEVFCLSCHRAHGTLYYDTTRWDNTQPSGIGTGCNKCHAAGS